MSRLHSIFHIVVAAILLFFSSCSTVIETADTFEMITFPDGSIAYLNHNSSVKYHEDFNPRNIRVEGEVFLNVSIRNGPFIIYARLAEIKVLGTELNIISTEDKVEVEVEEGQVNLKVGKHENTVNSGERATYKKGESKIKIDKAEYKFKSWIKSLEIEFKKLGKEIKHHSKDLIKDSKKIGKKLKKEMKSLDNK